MTRLSALISLLSLFLAGTAAAQTQGTLYLVVDAGDDQLYTVNVADATVTRIGQAGAIQSNAEGLAPSATPETILYSVNNSPDLDEVNVDGSGYTSVGGGNTLTDCDRGLAYNSATGKLYGSDNSSFCEINPTTGITTSLPSPPSIDTEGLAADPVNNYVYGIDYDRNLVRFDVNSNTWATVGPTVNISNGDDIGLAYDPDSQILYAAENNGELFSVNPASGLATLIGYTGLPSGDYGLAFVPDASNSDGTARFQVRKTFSDGSIDEVDVTLTCNAGLPLQQSYTIAGGGPGVSFVVTNLPDSGADCAVTETGSPDNYTASMDCEWTGVTGGTNVCLITNEANPATYTVSSDWIIGDNQFEEDSYDVEVTITCDSDILAVDDLPYTGGNSITVVLGDGDSVDAMVDTLLGTTACSATQDVVQSGVEPEASEGCTDAELTAGGSAPCMFTNTVFFEGIPTLNQYGMALMALLMLGLGLLGFRRFA